MNSRKTRLPEIVNILTHQAIASQEELSKQLAVKGFIVTQATLSRDLKLLKANKITDERGRYRYIVGEPMIYGRSRSRNRVASVASNHSAVISISKTGNLVVIKTRNGYASGLAYEIDMAESPVVLGTLPGADTVFVAIKEGATKPDLFNFFTNFVPASVMSASAAMFNDQVCD